MKKYLGFSGLFIVSGLVSTVHAAPLDDFLSAKTPMQLGSGSAEIAYDAVNKTLDVFHIRANDPQYAGTNVGDYSGVHARGNVNLDDKLSIDGGFWHRDIKYRSDTESLDSWQAAIQYLLAGNAYSDSLYAVRLSSWGDRAGTLKKSTPITVAGKTFDYIDVKDPHDVQFQADLIGTWKLNHGLTLSGLTGGGYSKVDAGSLVAGYKGCAYAVNFSDTTTSGSQVGPCGAVTSSSFSIPTHTNLSEGLTYNAKYAHAGFNLQWQYQQWTVKGGYLFEAFDRSHVDDIVKKLGNTPHKTNHIFDGEVAYQFTPGAEVFVHGEMMTNQFLGEIPFTYNAVTSSKFNGKYGFASFGLRMRFY